VGRGFLIVVYGLLAALSAQSSTISSLTNTIGNSFTDVSQGKSNVAFTDLLPMTTMSVTFSDNSTSSCTLSQVGSGGSGFVGCTNASAFNITLSPSNSQTNSAGWQITNLKAPGGLSIITVTINLNPQNAPSNTTIVTFDSSSITSRSGGSAISGSAVLTNAVHAPGVLPGNATDYGSLILSFSAGTFSGGSVFLFNAGNHFINGPLTVDTPEPSTYGLVGFGLAMLGFVKLRRKS
jgi:hypothetical protein